MSETRKIRKVVAKKRPPYFEMAEVFLKTNADFLQSVDEIEAAIVSGKVECVEAAMPMSAMIDAGCSQLDTELSRLQLYLPLGYREYIYGRSRDVEAFPSYNSRNVVLITPTKYMPCVVAAMRAMHDFWVREHSSEFFTDDSGKWRFLPFELLGWQRAERYLNCLIPFLDGIQMMYDRGLVAGEYERVVHRFKECYSIVSSEDVDWKLREGSRFYAAWSEEISRSMRETRASSYTMSLVATF